MTIFFSDVSHYDRDAGRQIPDGDQVVIAKSTHGTRFIDPAYTYHRDVAKARGIYFTSYHWLNHGNGAGQAQYCWQQIGRVPVMVDAEDMSGNTGYNGPIAVGDIVNFIVELRSLGSVSNLVYLPRWYWADHMGSPDLTPLVNLGVGLVSSNYTSYSDSGPGWVGYGGYTSVAQWQFTSTPMDRNAFKGSVSDYVALTSGGRPDVELTDPVPATGQNVGVVLSDIWNMIMRGHSGFVPTDIHYIGQRLNALAAAATAQGATLNALQVGGVDLDALAAKIAPLLPAPPTAAEVAEEIAKRLGNG
jgi:hypothetical protein